jgi:hypothetical protein
VDGTRCLAVALAVVALIVALPTPSAQPPSYAADIEPLFLKECQSCHTLDTPKADLILDPGTGFRALTEQGSTQVTGVRLVVPGDVEGSYLWAKLLGTAEIGKGMPRTLFGARKLPREQLDLVRTWIETGAQP